HGAADPLRAGPADCDRRRVRVGRGVAEEVLAAEPALGICLGVRVARARGLVGPDVPLADRTGRLEGRRRHRAGGIRAVEACGFSWTPRDTTRGLRKELWPLSQGS